MTAPKDIILNIVSMLTISKFFLSSLYSLLNAPDLCIHHPSDISSGYLIYILKLNQAKIELLIFPLISLFNVFSISVTGHSSHSAVQVQNLAIIIDIVNQLEVQWALKIDISLLLLLSL